MQSKELALAHMRKQIGDGTDTSLWFDRWLPQSSLIEYSGLAAAPSYTQNWKAADLMVNGVWDIRDHFAAVCF